MHQKNEKHKKRTPHLASGNDFGGLDVLAACFVGILGGSILGHWFVLFLTVFWAVSVEHSVLYSGFGALVCDMDFNNGHFARVLSSGGCCGMRQNLETTCSRCQKDGPDHHCKCSVASSHSMCLGKLDGT